MISIINNYILEFFGCNECVEHFKQELVMFPVPEGDPTLDENLGVDENLRGVGRGKLEIRF